MIITEVSSSNKDFCLISDSSIIKNKRKLLLLLETCYSATLKRQNGQNGDHPLP